MLRSPSDAEVRGSFSRSNARGRPTVVAMADGAIAVRNLADTGSDPWFCSMSVERNGVLAVELSTRTMRSVKVGDRILTGSDVRAWDALIRALPPDHARHSRAGDLAREAVAREAMSMLDAHSRALALTFGDAWAHIGGKLIDESVADGVLYDAPEGMTCRVLVVTCPSTSRKYGHCVPVSHKTAKAARRWMIGLGPQSKAPEVET